MYNGREKRDTKFGSRKRNLWTQNEGVLKTRVPVKTVRALLNTFWKPECKTG